MPSKKASSLILFSIVITLGLSISLQSLIAAAWIPPSANPPTNNLSEFINASATSQGKLGYFGIGTSAPNRYLHILKNDSNNAEIDIQSVAGAGNHWAIYHDSTSADLRFWNNTPTGEKNILTLDNGGNVGIGITSPGAKLEVAGQIKITGGIPGAGKVLLSDSAGLGSWVATSSLGIGGSGLPTGTSGYTLRHDGTNWVSNNIIFNNGTNVGIGDASPASLLSVGNGDLFQVNSSGNIVKVNNITYSWPAAQGAASTVLTNNGAGTLTWTAAGSGLPAGTSGQTLRHDGTSWVANSNLYNNGTNVGIGTASPNKKLHVYQDTGDNAEIDIQSVSGATNYWALYHDRATADLRFWNNTPAGEKNIFTITNEGNVGIGTTGPRNGLELAKLDSNYITSLRVGGILQGNSGAAIGAETSRHQILFSSWRDSFPDTVGAKVVAINTNQFSTALVQYTDLAFYTLGSWPGGTDATTEKMRITNNGNVGIGTINPLTKFDVKGATTGSVIRATVSDGAGSSDFGYGFFVDTQSYELAAINANYTNSGTGGWANLIFKTRNGSLSEKMRITDTGNVGIGDASPASLLSVGNGDLFQVNSSGNIVKVNNITYSWPAAQGAASTVLTNNGSGTLTWTAAGSGLPAGTSGQTLRHNGTTWVANSNLYNNGTDVGIGTMSPGALLDVYKGAVGQLFHVTGATEVFSVEEWTSGINVGLQATAKNLYLNRNAASGSDTYVGRSGNELVVKSGGNVGIGIASPSQKLDVVGNAILSGNYKLYIRDTNHYVGAGRNNDFSLINNAAEWMRIGSANGIAMWGAAGADSNDSPHLFLNTSGNVGIGTASPNAKLDVVGGNINLDGDFVFWGTSNRWIFHTPDDGRTSLFLAPRGASDWDWGAGTTFANNGNVGIGTGSPGAKLDVNGAILATQAKINLASAGTSLAMENNYNSGYNGALLKFDLGDHTTSISAESHYYTTDTDLNLCAGGHCLKISKNGTITGVGLISTFADFSTAQGGMVTCPAGTYIISGGCDCHNQAIRTSIPNGTTSWVCGCGDVGNYHYAYAVCSYIAP